MNASHVRLPVANPVAATAVVVAAMQWRRRDTGDADRVATRDSTAAVDVIATRAGRSESQVVEEEVMR